MTTVIATAAVFFAIILLFGLRFYQTKQSKQGFMAFAALFAVGQFFLLQRSTIAECEVLFCRSGIQHGAVYGFFAATAVLLVVWLSQRNTR